VHSTGNAAVAERWKAARRLVAGYVEHYNNVRLNSATGYITPKDVLADRQQEIHAERDRKLEAARQQRQGRRQQAARKAKRPATAMSDSPGVARLWFADNAESTQRQGQAHIQRSESPCPPEESLHLGTRAAVEGSPSVRQSAAH
jgi:hypothetical protein